MLKIELSLNIVRELCGVQTLDNVNMAVIVTSSFFSDDAIHFADKKAFMSLADFNKLMEWIRYYQ